MKLLKWADGFVNCLGLGNNLVEHVPRHFRWLSLGALCALIAGAAILILSLSGTILGWLWGAALYLIATVLAAFLQIFGPLRRATGKNPLDERERALRTEAYNVAGRTVALVAVVGAWSMTAAVMINGIVITPAFWWIIAWLLSGLLSIMPCFYASWTTKPLPPEFGSSH